MSIDLLESGALYSDDPGRVRADYADIPPAWRHGRLRIRFSDGANDPELHGRGDDRRPGAGRRRSAEPTTSQGAHAAADGASASRRREQELLAQRKISMARDIPFRPWISPVWLGVGSSTLAGRSRSDRAMASVRSIRSCQLGVISHAGQTTSRSDPGSAPRRR